MFGTSVTGTADLGSWPDADMATGLAAADVICQARATAAGLDNPSAFVAWISDSNDDAYCRIHGAGGTIAANCGMAQLPVAAGPWQRTDGFPLAPEIQQWLAPDNEMYSTIQFDEFGAALPAFAAFFTATDPDGARSGLGSTCGDWTNDTSDTAVTGSETRSSANWTNSGSLQCSADSARLICVETGTGPPLQLPDTEGSVAFLTAATGTGNLGSWPDAGGQAGIAAGDAICQAEAAAAQLQHSSSFVAWLSDDGVSAIDRLTHDGPWVRPDGVLIAESKADLTDHVLFAPLNVSAAGDYFANWAVWTGTLWTGNGTGMDCDNWTSSDPAMSGGYGPANEIRFWTDPFTFGCDFASARLYCFSNMPALFFSHGFENSNP